MRISRDAITTRRKTYMLEMANPVVRTKLGQPLVRKRRHKRFAPRNAQRLNIVGRMHRASVARQMDKTSLSLCLSSISTVVAWIPGDLQRHLHYERWCSIYDDVVQVIHAIEAHLRILHSHQLLLPFTSFSSTCFYWLQISYILQTIHFWHCRSRKRKVVQGDDSEKRFR